MINREKLVDEQQQQPFNGLWSGITRVGRYQKKHSPTHIHPDHRASFITFLHLQGSMASSLFNLRAWQSSCTTSFQVFFGLLLGLEPSTSCSIHFFTQSSSSFRNTWPYQRSLFCCNTNAMSSTPSLSLSSLLGSLSFSLTPHIHLTILISALVWYGKCSAIITKVSHALNTLVSGDKPDFQTLSKGLVVLLCSEVVRQRVPDHGTVHSECSASVVSRCRGTTISCCVADLRRCLPTTSVTIVFIIISIVVVVAWCLFPIVTPYTSLFSLSTLVYLQHIHVMYSFVQHVPHQSLLRFHFLNTLIHIILCISRHLS